LLTFAPVVSPKQKAVLQVLVTSSVSSAVITNVLIFNTRVTQTGDTIIRNDHWPTPFKFDTTVFSHMTSPILTDYDARVAIYDGFRKYLESLLPQLISAAEIPIHKIETRLKSRPGLQEKINRPNKDYSNLDQITDICGARIITYFAADVDAIASLLEKEFQIDRANSIDKRIYADPDRFGYASLHYVISLTTERSKLTECKAWLDDKAEVQVRTIIQHAWAEIEHDLGFKSPIAIPRQVKRRFSRLAALLETADDEFAGIKADLRDYAQDVSTDLEDPEADIQIDGTSIAELIKSDPLVKECDTAISKRSGRPLGPADDGMCSGLAMQLHSVGITSVEKLRQTIAAHKEAIITVALQRISGKKVPIGAGISLLYTSYAVLAEIGSVERFVEFFQRNFFGGDDLRLTAREIIAAFAQQSPLAALRQPPPLKDAK
jgi:GTP pyrophosphokinase